MVVCDSDDIGVDIIMCRPLREITRDVCRSRSNTETDIIILLIALCGKVAAGVGYETSIDANYMQKANKIHNRVRAR